MKKIGLILVVFALLFGCASTVKSPEEGKTAPDFIVTDVSGDEVRLSDFKGEKNLVLVFYSDST
jgi:cytochrome oxidase Cu insertion factor (SCO1/SenC/PrrC family)